MEIASSAFSHNGSIPRKYTCDGDRALSPPLSIRGVPEGVVSLALVMDDPDIPQKFKEERGVNEFVHWVVYDIPPQTTEIPEGSMVGKPGMHGRGEPLYTGPCPPPEYEPSEHRYVFTLYALGETPIFDTPPTKDVLLDTIQPHILETAELIGRYTRTP